MDVRELYQQVILDHNRSPRNFGHLDHPTHSAEGRNPLCGDQLTLELAVDAAGTIADVKFEGSGCAISKASASLMTDWVKGRPVAEAEQMFQDFHDLVTSGTTEAPDRKRFGKLAALAGVREFPARVKCASLAWHTLHAALAGERKISTE